MTTILYHNHLLLADSRTSRNDIYATGDINSFHCVHCNQTFQGFRDTSIKIRIPAQNKKILFRKEIVLAAAASGLSSDAENQTRAVTTLTDYEESYKDSYKFISTGKSLVIKARLLIVTNKSVYVIDFERSNNYGLHAHKHSLEDTVAIGSGAMAAKTAIIAYGASPFEAMKVASVVDKSTGGPTNYVNFKQEIEIQTYSDLKDCEVQESKTKKQTKLKQTPEQDKYGKANKKPCSKNNQRSP